MKIRVLIAASALGLAAGCAESPPRQLAAGDASRGRLLYDTACVACHTTQMHWRDNRLVRSWPGLLQQVDRWQAVAGQNWSATEVSDVASYLNERFYQLPAPEKS